MEKQNQKMSDWLTPKQYAERYQISVKTVRRWIASGHVDAKRYGPRLIRIYDPKIESKQK